MHNAGVRAVGRLVAVLLLGMGVLCACDPTASPLTVADVYLSSRQAGDLDSAVAMFAAGAAVRAPNEVVYTGPAQIRSWLEVTLRDYYYQPQDAPAQVGDRVFWTENLYSRSSGKWVGEVSSDVQISADHIQSMKSAVVKGASGVICPLCPPLITSPG